MFEGVPRYIFFSLVILFSLYSYESADLNLFMENIYK